MEDGDAGGVGLRRPSKQLNITMGAGLEKSMRFPSLKIQYRTVRFQADPRPAGTSIRSATGFERCVWEDDIERAGVCQEESGWRVRVEFVSIRIVRSGWDSRVAGNASTPGDIRRRPLSMTGLGCFISY